jgi:hypothetical protein
MNVAILTPSPCRRLSNPCPQVKAAAEKAAKEAADKAAAERLKEAAARAAAEKAAKEASSVNHLILSAGPASVRF